MNGVLEKRRQRVLGQMQLSFDLVVPVEKLFQTDFAGLKRLDQQMFELAQREPWS